MGVNISELVQSSRYKNFMKYLYGWGASIVLVGALFKLQHWPGAGIMLTVGMLTEAVIFFFSAFEPIVEEVDWSLVYPELAGITDDAHLAHSRGAIDPMMLENVISSALSKANLVASAPAPARAPERESKPAPAPAAPVAAGQTGAFVFTQKFNDMLEKAEISPELFMKIGSGLDRLSQASNGIARISEAVAASETFTHNMQRAGNAVGKFAQSYEESGALVSRASKVLSDSFSGTASSVDESGKALAKGVKEIVESMNTKLGTASSTVGDGVTKSAEHIAALNKNLGSLVAQHELQVRNMEKRTKESEALSNGIEDMLRQLSQTAQDSRKYGESVAKLNENVSKLNAVYGNMLSAMGSVNSGR